MNDVAKWKLRGPVRTLRTETAEWDASREAWKPPRHFNVVDFRADGKIGASEFHNPDGTTFRTVYRYDDRGRLLEVQSGAVNGPVSKSIYSYDEAGRHLRTVSVDADGTTREAESCRYDSTGRKTKVTFLNTPPLGVAVGYGIEGTDHAVGAPGATTMTTTYGERDLPEEVVMHDANHAVVRRMTFTRDREGRVLSEEVQFGGQLPFPDMQKEGVSPQETAALAAMFAQVFAGRTMHSTTYAYDRHGRLLERTMRMGALGGDRVTYRYDDRDNPIEEITEGQSREIGADTDGTLRTQKEDVRSHGNRSEYQYDSEGNWTERIVSSQMGPNGIYQRSNVQRRQITYYAR